MIGDNDAYLINDYLDHNLSEKEIGMFEQRLENDSNFRLAASEQYEINHRLDIHEKQQKIEEWQQVLAATKQQNIPKRSKVKQMWQFAWQLAALLLLFVGMYFLWPNTTSNVSQQLAIEYWDKTAKFNHGANIRDTSGLPVPIAKNAYAHYHRKHYTEALQELEQIPRPLKPREQMLKGACYFQLQQHENCIKYFEAIVNGNTPLKDEAHWYLALSYLQANEITTARTLLEVIVNKQSWNSDKAKDLLKQLATKP